jgi:hypothetical protein
MALEPEIAAIVRASSYASACHDAAIVAYWKGSDGAYHRRTLIKEFAALAAEVATIRVFWPEDAEAADAEVERARLEAEAEANG